MFRFLFSWWIGQGGLKISCTNSQTLVNLRLPNSSGHHGAFLQNTEDSHGKRVPRLCSLHFVFLFQTSANLYRASLKGMSWVARIETECSVSGRPHCWPHCATKFKNVHTPPTVKLCIFAFSLYHYMSPRDFWQRIDHALGSHEVKLARPFSYLHLNYS